MDVQDLERKYEALLATQRETITRLVYERDAAYATIQTLEQTLKGQAVLDREDHQAIHAYLQRVDEAERRASSAYALAERAVRQTAGLWTKLISEDACDDTLDLAEVVFDNVPTLRTQLAGYDADPAEVVTNVLDTVVVRPGKALDVRVDKHVEGGNEQWTVTLLHDGVLGFRPPITESASSLERALYAACAAASQRLARTTLRG